MMCTAETSCRAASSAPGRASPPSPAPIRTTSIVRPGCDAMSEMKRSASGVAASTKTTSCAWVNGSLSRRRCSATGGMTAPSSDGPTSAEYSRRGSSASTTKRCSLLGAGRLDIATGLHLRHVARRPHSWHRLSDGLHRWHGLLGVRAGLGFAAELDLAAQAGRDLVVRIRQVQAGAEGVARAVDQRIDQHHFGEARLRIRQLGHHAQERAGLDRAEKLRRYDDFDAQRVDRREPHDRLFLDALAGREIALGNDAVCRAADGSHAELRLGELELAIVDAALLARLREPLLGDVRVGARLLQRLARDELALHQILGALVLASGEVVVRLRCLDLGGHLRLARRDAHRRALDVGAQHRDHLALPHAIAPLDFDRLDDADDRAADLDDPVRLDEAAERLQALRAGTPREREQRGEGTQQAGGGCGPGPSAPRNGSRPLAWSRRQSAERAARSALWRRDQAM